MVQLQQPYNSIYIRTLKSSWLLSALVYGPFGRATYTINLISVQTSYISLKSWILCGLSFFQIELFYLLIPRKKYLLAHICLQFWRKFVSFCYIGTKSQWAREENISVPENLSPLTFFSVYLFLQEFHQS